ncbi:MAG: RelA/SpoT family protein, partial [Bacteroidota bacterium]
MAETATINEEEKKLILGAYRSMLGSINSKMNAEDKVNMRKAYEIAVKAHAKQRRKSGEPYILHPIEVARIAAEEMGLGPTAVVAALLHDVVEDSEVTIEEIGDTFGPKIKAIVDGLTKLDGAYDVESPQAENFKKVLSTLIYDVRVVLIKMADRLHNMRTLGSMPRHKQLKIAAETSYIYAPLAHRLGLYNVKTEFQDLVMKINEPDVYQELAQKLQDTKAERNSYIDDFIKPLKGDLDKMGMKYRINGRPKSISSIYNKIKKKGVPFEEIYDLYAVRIIIDTVPEREKSLCWQVYSVVTDVHQPIPERLKDWITTPKSNGYESLHTTVVGPKGRFVEVQIRTERMDEIAERGFAAHWKYKEVKNQQDMYDTWLDSIREILDTQHTDAIEFLNDFKTNLFNEEVYVYTPNGDLKILPKGATALDFAFHIHSDIGYHCTAVKVNNKLVPMGYKLNNGDQITVITKKSQKPTESWLKMVVTGKAKSKIRSAMKEEQRLVGSLGKETLQRKLKNMKLDFEVNVDFLADQLNFNNRFDLYFAIANEQVNITEVIKSFRVEGNKLFEIEEVKEQVKEEAPKVKKKFTGKSQIMVNGESADQYGYSLAGCCNPVQGDDIFAYLSANSGLKIHRTNCPNSTHLMANFGYRIMKAEWTNQTNRDFVVDLIINGIDDGVGVIERVTSTISSDLGINIRSFSISGKQGFFEGKISLHVLNKDQL